MGGGGGGGLLQGFTDSGFSQITSTARGNGKFTGHEGEALPKNYNLQFKNRSFEGTDPLHVIRSVACI